MARERKTSAPGARAFLPEKITLASLREAVQGCRGCPIYEKATQAVFGEGRQSARIMMVGEQPGNEEDLKGRPFVGPAGRILDQALAEASIDRADVYVTNVVKHFKWTPQGGTRRLHKKPSSREITDCLPWLEEELELVKPEVLICLGATAAKAILGKTFKVTVQHGQILPSRFSDRTMATVHPSSILRKLTSEDRHAELERLITDLKVVGNSLK